MFRSLPHLTLTTSISSLSPTSLTFPTFSPTQVLWRTIHIYPVKIHGKSEGQTQIPSLTGYETKMISTTTLRPEEIELDRNLGTDPCQTQERITGENYQNPTAEDMDEFGKVGVEMSYVQS